MQRALDIMLSLAGLLLLSPLLLLVAVVLRCTGEGEVFYRQQRIGLAGVEFGLFKFATMLKHSPSIGTGTITLRDDPRVLPVGRFLRKSKINELPQLLNVLLGDMSLVGPRPQTRRCFNAFPERSRASIVRVRPGLTGIGSLVFRNEEALMDGAADADRFYDDVIMPYKGKLEEWYVANASLGLYCKLLLLTHAFEQLGCQVVGFRTDNFNFASQNAIASRKTFGSLLANCSAHVVPPSTDL